MRCSHCNTPMMLLREESGNRSYLRWHSCPHCGSTHMSSAPVRLSQHPIDLESSSIVRRGRSKNSSVRM